jgi:hypothetical protein
MLAAQPQEAFRQQAPKTIAEDDHQACAWVAPLFLGIRAYMIIGTAIDDQPTT